jgi:hypothetical protein
LGPLHDYLDLVEKKKRKDKMTSDETLDQILSDSQLRDIVADALGRPMALLKKKFAAGKTSWGVPCQLCLCYFPQGSFEAFPSKPVRALWKEVAANDNIPFLDMTDDFQAFRYTYFPFSGLIGIDHFGKDGHTLFAELLAYELIKKKIIPFKTSNSQ